jgi:hypothetical protein
MPPIANAQQFREKWISWWGSCQPKWRSTKTWPYPHGDAKDKDWSRLNVTGPHALFAIVVTTSWWIATMDEDSRDTFDAMIEDLHWVIGNLAHFNSSFQTDGHEPDIVTNGHSNRDPGKRQVKLTLKARENN